jgi:hypothetical protein
MLLKNIATRAAWISVHHRSLFRNSHRDQWQVTKCSLFSALHTATYHLTNRNYFVAIVRQMGESPIWCPHTKDSCVLLKITNFFMIGELRVLADAKTFMKMLGTSQIDRNKHTQYTRACQQERAFQNIRISSLWLHAEPRLSSAEVWKGVKDLHRWELVRVEDSSFFGCLHKLGSILRS